MTRPTPYLVRMIAFLAIVAGLIGALLLEPVLKAFLHNPALNGLILGVLALGILHSLRQVWTLDREVTWMETFRRRRPGLSIQATPKLLAPVALAMGDREKPVRLSTVSMRSLLDGVSARLEEAGDISRYVIGLLIFLGLLGTFWGLLETMGSIGGVIGGLDLGGGDLAQVFRDLKTGLQQPLTGMGTAFSASLFGLSGSLVLGFLDLQAGQAQNRFFNELEDWMAGQTRLSSQMAPDTDQPVPAYIQALLEQTAEGLDDLQRVVARAEEGRLAGSRGLQELAQKLDALTEQMRAEQGILVRLAEQHIEMRPLLAALVEQRAQSAGGDPVLREHARSMDASLQRLLGEMGAGRAELVQDVRSEIKLLARTIAAREEQRTP